MRFGGLPTACRTSLRAAGSDRRARSADSRQDHAVRRAVGPPATPDRRGVPQRPPASKASRDAPRARRGLARTFQQLELFMGLTVREHVVLADRVRHAPPAAVARHVHCRVATPNRPTSRRPVWIASSTSWACNRSRNHSTASLPLGTARLVEIARALAGNPAVILLDEPSSGLDSARPGRWRRRSTAPGRNATRHCCSSNTTSNC